MIIKMFEEIESFVGRLDVYIKHNITDKLKGIIVDILAQVLVVLGVATKWIKQGCPSKNSCRSLGDIADDFIAKYSMVLLRKNKEVTDAM